ncbi:DUF2877 domain-containing protein [Thermaerobacter subterraneus]|uniref:DUF2877 domain-containing protein n=1 Tax=Thermaerobacter subterraneus DSM 13965 TaxID=867903 RepID=K6P3J9_9FIRM|nr:DUF2877 domain-containing protein [Thermaerobacter subterraneus]EKP95620.1 Protein of unknown function (DUF2877) [Thermaerobacter subterraneus DSM 13965]
MDGRQAEAGGRVPPRFTGRVVAVHRQGVYAEGVAGWDEPGPGPWSPAPPAFPAPLAPVTVIALGDGFLPPGPWHLRLPAGPGSVPAPPASRTPAPHDGGWRRWLAAGDPVRWGPAGGQAGRGGGAVAIPPPGLWRRWFPPGGARGAARARRRAAAVLGHLLAVAPPPGWKRLAQAVAQLERAVAAGRWDEAAQPALALLGAGPGLTPSGDDWLAGWSAYWAWRAGARPGRPAPPPGSPAWEPAAGGGPGGGGGGAAFHRWAAWLRNEAARRTGPVSRALLDAALDGELPEPAAGLLAALWSGDAPAVPRAARRLFRTGHSSGVDLAWGLWMAARRDAGGDHARQEGAGPAHGENGRW